MTKKLALSFVLFTVMLDAIGIGLIMPVMPDLIIELGGQDLSHAALWGGAMNASFAVMQFLFGPMVGNISDRYGRRVVLITSLTVMSVDFLIMGFAHAIWLLFLGRIIGGITAANQSTANAVVADLAPPEEKAAYFGLLGAAFGVGFILGPLLGGLLSEFGSRTPFFVAAVFAGSNAVFGYFVLPETVTDTNRRPFEWRRANPFSALRQIGKLGSMRGLLLVFFIYQLAFMVYPSVWSYFSQERFGWDARLVGISLAIFGAFMAISQGWLMGQMVKKLNERRTIQIGIVITVFSFAILSVLSNSILVLVLLPLAALGSITGPTLQASMSRETRDDSQGELQGILTSVTAVSTIIAPLFMTNIFAHFTNPDALVYFPGAPFAISSLLTLGAGILFFRLGKLSFED